MTTELTVWSHDPFSVNEDVLMDPAVLPDAHLGDIAELSAQAPNLKEKRNLLFKVGPKPDSSAQLSVNSSVLNSLSILPRSIVQIRKIDLAQAKVDSIQLKFKGIYITRADIYKISKMITGQCVRVGQRVQWLGGHVRLQVEGIYKGGKRKYTGYVDKDTHIVYRSDSARVILLIQVSSEMFSFNETGEISLQKLLNSFIPESLRQWSASGAQHTVTIILFTSVSGSNRKSKLLPGELESKPQNFYRVAIDSAPIARWSDILTTLKNEFNTFLKDVLLNDKGEIIGSLLPSSKGNVLEALKLTTTFSSNKFTDRDLCRTNQQVILATPSPGLFDVDEVEFYQLSRIILSVEIGVELVCLTRPPLHQTPMFRAKTMGGELKYYIPTWVNVSFWGPTEKYIKQWIPRCVIREIQMMGIMENEKKAISVRHLVPGPYSSRFMKNYDMNLFKSHDIIESQRMIENLVSTPTSQSLQLRPQPIGNIKKPLASTATFLASPTLLPAVETSTALSPLIATTSTGSSAQGDRKPVNARDALGAFLKGTTERKLNKKLSIGTFRSALSSVANTSSPVLSPDESTFSDSISTFNIQRPLEAQFSPEPPALSPAKPVPIPDRGAKMASNFQQDRMLARSFRAGQNNISTSIARASYSPQRLLTPKGISVSPRSPFGTVEPKVLVSQSDMWRVLKNPSVVDHPTDTEAFGRWANVIIKGRKRKAVSWNSLKSPACLPMTSYVFPTVQELQDEYEFQFYDIASPSDGLPITKVMDEFIGARLQMGFQIAIGEEVLKAETMVIRGDASKVRLIIPEENYIGVRLFMIREGAVHRIAIEQDGLINVRIYTWVNRDPRLDQPLKKPAIKIRTKFDTKYRNLEGIFFDPLAQYKVNWNSLDQQLAGLVDSTSPGAFYSRAIRFLIIPTSAKQEQNGNESATLENSRIDGIIKVCNTLYKHRVGSTNNNNVPQLQFYTGSLSAAIDHMTVVELNSDKDPILQPDRLMKSIALPALAAELLGKWGPRIHSKRWHWRTYQYSFIGSQLLTWLLNTFSDIDTEDDAVAYANQLIEAGLLKSINNRQRFTNGYYFYSLAPEYEPEENPSQPTTNTASENLPRNSAEKPRIVLSRCITVDIDPKNVSDRVERAQFHIDRFHNPDNAFNVRVEWLNATPRLLDEMMNNIRRICDSHNLKLVQVPASDIQDTECISPFRTSYKVSFCIDPLTVVESPDQYSDKPFYFHFQFLKRMGFVFDGTETSHEQGMLSEHFTLDYTWKTNELRKPTFIHHSGSVLVQVLDEGSFFMVPNTIFLSRYVTGTGAQAGTEDKIQQMFEKFCHNADALTQIFNDITKDDKETESMPNLYTTPNSSGDGSNTPAVFA